MEKVSQPVSLPGALQLSRRLLALTGLHFENQGWPFPETEPFVQAACLTPEFLFQLVADCRAKCQCLLQTIDVNV